jgi:hypothetical protein
LKEVRCTPATEGGSKAAGSAREEKAQHPQAQFGSEKEPATENRLVAEKSGESKTNDKVGSPDPPASETKVEEQCTLTGDKLFLIDAVSADPDFTSSVTVPDGFVEGQLAIPMPKDKTLYIKLRDDPSTVDKAVLPVTEARH